MITITKSPVSPNGIYVPFHGTAEKDYLEWRSATPNNNKIDFKYIVRINDASGELASFSVVNTLNDNGTNVGSFNMFDYVRHLIRPDNQPQGTSVYHNSQDSVLHVKISITEYYDGVEDVGTLTSTGALLVLDVSKKNIDGKFAYSYVTNSDTSLALTNLSFINKMPTWFQPSLALQWLGGHSDANYNSTTIKAVTSLTDSTGFGNSSVHDLSIYDKLDNSGALSIAPFESVLNVPFGFDYNGLSSYYTESNRFLQIRFRDSSDNDTSILYEYEYIQCATRFIPYVVSWKNDLGGMDFFTFYGKNDKTVDYGQKMYKKDIAYAGSKVYNNENLNREDTIYSKTVIEALTLTTDWLKQVEIDYLEELFRSTEVYLSSEDEGDIPVTVGLDTQMFPKKGHKGLFAKTVTFTFANQKRIR